MIDIVKANQDDLLVIQELAKEIWPFAYGEILSLDQLEYMLDKFYSIKSLTDQINTFHHEFFLAVRHNVPVGFISIGKYADDSSVSILHKIYVLPKLQGKKIGKSLLLFAIEKAKLDGASVLQLNVNRNNKAFHFYIKNGFEVMLEEDIDIGSGYFMNDYRMELTL